MRIFFGTSGITWGKNFLGLLLKQLSMFEKFGVTWAFKIQAATLAFTFVEATNQLLRNPFQS